MLAEGALQLKPNEIRSLKQFCGFLPMSAAILNAFSLSLQGTIVCVREMLAVL